jgi:hypothetical protein
MTTTTILSDNGVSSGSAGIKTTGGNDGTLQLQTTTAGGAATTAVTIGILQNVGIGTTDTTDQRLKIKQSADTGAASFSFKVEANANDTGLFLGYRGVGAASAADTCAISASYSSTGAFKPITFLTSDTERMRILSTGNILSLSGGSTTATGTGIAFPATQSASSDANTLDDYEEGTYTATMTCSTSGTITLGTNTLSYTKIGRQVTVTGYLAASAISSPTGAIYINLPIPPANSLTTQTSAVVLPNSLASGNILNYWSYISSASNRIEIFLGGATGVAFTSAQTVSASTEFRIFATYFSS